ncbi:MAG: protein translocase subunit SecD [Ilumatobacteraceae bacterium]|nr:protein translocase subunit SecD [Ilumatobacteraceae bacterium]
MSRSALWASLLGTVAIAIALLVVNVATRNSPVLGLDLQGGVSVILTPTEDASGEDLTTIRDLIRDELESRGIAEPDVRVEGENIVVDLPGVKDQQDALAAVDIAGIVTLRPVIGCNPVDPATTTTTTAPTTSTPTADPTDPAAPGVQETLPVRGGTEECVVGPAGGTGEVFSRGSAGVEIDQTTGQWIVTVDLRGEGEQQWNLLASQCFAGSSSCPSRQLAIVLDGVIQSAPVVNAPSFSGSVSISGDFSESEARDLSRVLNRGAFPVDVEAQSVQTVSPTLGTDSLRAAVVSGIVGIILVLLLLTAYYQKLAVVVVGGLIVWGMVVYSAASLVSQWTNYSLSLAGATGIIVAIGVTADSYIVLFERLRDEMRAGRSARNAAPRSFSSTWRTIVAADLVSILASFILFWLSAGSVRGFALFLGLTAICDLIVCFFFTRPAVILLTRTRWFEPRPVAPRTAEALA